MVGAALILALIALAFIFPKAAFKLIAVTVASVAFFAWITRETPGDQKKPERAERSLQPSDDIASTGDSTDHCREGAPISECPYDPEIGDRVKVEKGCPDLGSLEKSRAMFVLMFSSENEYLAIMSRDKRAWYDNYLRRWVEFTNAHCNVSGVGTISARKKSPFPNCVEQKAEAVKAGRLEEWNAGGMPRCDAHGDFFRVSLDRRGGDVWQSDTELTFVDRNQQKPQPACVAANGCK
jgi:hypothetical protein